MREEDTMTRRIGHLKRHYYGTIISLTLLFLLILCRIIPLFRESDLVGVTMERYAIMISIIAIPLALKIFANQMKKIPRPSVAAVALRKYTNASYLRLYTISAVTLLHILLFGFSRNMNFMWMMVVLFIIFLYCKPSYSELASLSETPEEKTDAVEEPINLFEDNLIDDEEAAGK